MKKEHESLHASVTLPYTIYGGVPGALSTFGMSFVCVFIPVFFHFTGGVTDHSVLFYVLFGFLSLFGIYVGLSIMLNRVKITEDGLLVYQVVGWNIFPFPKNVSWNSIERIDVGFKAIKDTSPYGPNQIALLQFTSIGQKTPVDINATLYKSGNGLVVLGKYIFEMVPHERISDHARRVLRLKVE